MTAYVSLYSLRRCLEHEVQRSWIVRNHWSTLRNLRLETLGTEETLSLSENTTGRASMRLRRMLLGGLYCINYVFQVPPPSTSYDVYLDVESTTSTTYKLFKINTKSSDFKRKFSVIWTTCVRKKKKRKDCK